MLCMLFVTLKDLQPGLEKVLQFWVARIGYEDSLERIVDRLVIGDFIVGVSLVERRAIQFAEFGLFGLRLLEERLAGVIVLRGYVQLLDQRQSLIVDRGVI